MHEIGEYMPINKNSMMVAVATFAGGEIAE